ncbi:MAG: hypothetical protein DBY43_06390 [Clostridiaceae bacterium]|nr:MAG: hypothetical protein DBY43_06390 [Clostridiaceae bacterium]
MITYSVINRYGKTITVSLKGQETSLFKTQDFARLLAKRLNSDERKPKWLVNRVDWKSNRPYSIKENKF